MSELSEIMSRLSAEQTKYDTKKTKAQATRVRASLLELKKPVMVRANLHLKKSNR